MNREQQINFLIDILLDEMPELKKAAEKVSDRRKLLRALMNVRPPLPLRSSFITVQDQLLRAESIEKGVVTLDQIPPVEKNIRLWQGDITRLKVDAIVNAANSQMLGCFVPCHGCIDNAIHSAAGLQLRQACFDLMSKQNHDEPIGHAKITPAFNLPSKFVIHTVGPIVDSRLTVEHEKLLADCYQSCLKIAVENDIRSIAFCCISTGEFHFPNERAAQIAVATVKNFFVDNSIEVVFNVFKDFDRIIYQKILGGL